MNPYSCKLCLNLVSGAALREVRNMEIIRTQQNRFVEKIAKIKSLAICTHGTGVPEGKEREKLAKETSADIIYGMTKP